MVVMGKKPFSEQLYFGSVVGCAVRMVCCAPIKVKSKLKSLGQENRQNFCLIKGTAYKETDCKIWR